MNMLKIILLPTYGGCTNTVKKTLICCITDENARMSPLAS